MGFVCATKLVTIDQLELRNKVAVQLKLNTVIDKADSLLRLPDSAMRVFELTQANDTTLDTLVDAIQIDPPLVAKLLRLVNSSLFSRGRDITQIDRAVAILGYQEVGHIAMIMSAAKELEKVETELLRASSFWNHSLTTAILARHAAAQQGVQGSGTFVAALLHDLGLPIQFALCGSEMTDVLDMSLLEDDLDLVQAEQQVLGFDHTEVGAALCKRWQLPDVIEQSARYHHAPQNAALHQETVAIVAWANIVESLGTTADPTSIECAMSILSEIEKILPLPLPTDNELLQEAQTEAAELLAFI